MITRYEKNILKRNKEKKMEPQFELEDGVIASNKVIYFVKSIVDVDLHIAGSIRRKTPFIGNIDLVVLRSDWDLVKEILPHILDTSMFDEKPCCMTHGTIDNIMCAFHPTPKEHFGTALWWATGPDTFNINTMKHAESNSFTLYRDILLSIKKDNKSRFLPTPTEQTLFDAIGLDYVEPMDRF